ncbi:hypothetical protein D9M68_887380 [compost metagenome]
MGMPSTLPPKSSTAMRSATADPCPPMSANSELMSVSTPIFTGAPGACAQTPMADSVSTTAEVSCLSFLLAIFMRTPGWLERITKPGCPDTSTVSGIASRRFSVLRLRWV